MVGEGARAVETDHELDPLENRTPPPAASSSTIESGYASSSD